LALTPQTGVKGGRMPPYHICSRENGSKKVPQFT
jgi:hypothetical protein